MVGLVIFAAWFIGAGERVPVPLGGAAFIAAGVVNRPVGFDAPGAIVEPAYTFDDSRTPASDTVRRAGYHMPQGGIWIVPPDFETFGHLAGRAVVVDFTSIPFDGKSLREWLQRVRATYGDLRGVGFSALEAMKNNYRDFIAEGEGETWDYGALTRQTAAGQLAACRHDGSWRPKDTRRDQAEVEALWLADSPSRKVRL